MQIEASALTADIEIEAFGLETQLSPTFTVEELPGVQVIGRYADNSVAAAYRETDAGTSYYIGALHAPAALLRRIIAKAGVHLYTSTDDIVLTDGEFIGVVSTSVGTKSVRLPASRTWVDALTNETTQDDADTLELEMKLGETRLFWLRQP